MFQNACSALALALFGAFVLYGSAGIATIVELGRLAP